MGKQLAGKLYSLQNEKAGPEPLPHDSRRSMRRLIRNAVLAAALLPIATTAFAQRGGRGNDTTGGRAGLPMTPTKALKFTTDEGTWLNLDLSPDGRTIVF